MLQGQLPHTALAILAGRQSRHRSLGPQGWPLQGCGGDEVEDHTAQAALSRAGSFHQQDT